MKFRFLPAALAEVRDAARFYESRVQGLGLDFVGEVRRGISRVVAHPTAWGRLDDRFRRCLLARFPHALIYTIESDEILIVAVMHLHRSPDRWRENL